MTDLHDTADEIFPTDDVKASLADGKLQSRAVKELRPDEKEMLEDLRSTAVAAGAPESAAWIYFRSPDVTWQALCGREGWLLFDAAEEMQYEFLMTVMN